MFRDEVWGRLRTVFQADHRAYKELGWYDCPMWDAPTHVMAAVGTMGGPLAYLGMILSLAPFGLRRCPERDNSPKTEGCSIKKEGQQWR